MKNKAKKQNKYKINFKKKMKILKNNQNNNKAI